MSPDEFKKIKKRAGLFDECLAELCQAFQDIKYLRNMTGNEYAGRRMEELRVVIEKLQSV